MKKLALLLMVMLLAVSMLVMAGCTNDDANTGDDVNTGDETNTGDDTNSDDPYADITETINLSMSSPNANNVYISQAQDYWADQVEAATDGRVMISDRTWGGALVKSDAILESLQSGVVDLCLLANNFYPTKTPLHNALMPFFYCNFEALGPVMVEAFNTMPELKAEYDAWNVTPVYWLGGASVNLNTTFEVDPDSLKPLAGKNIYSVGTAPQMWVTALGGTPVNITATDVYTGLDKGTVNGTMTMSPTFLTSYKLAEVVTQVVDYRYCGTSMWVGMGMNTDVYNSLPESVKTLIADLADDTQDKANELLYAQLFQGYADAEANGVELVQLTVEQADAWREAANIEAGWEDAIKMAEDAGVANTRDLHAQFLSMIDEYLADVEQLSIMEEYQASK